MKKLIKLTEIDLHNIVNESVKRILTENRFSIDPTEIARQLYNNGDDFTLFVHWLEKEYSMLKSEEQYQNDKPKWDLVRAIKNSSDYNDLDGELGEGYYEGDAPLSSPYGKDEIVCIGYRFKQGEGLEFYGYQNSEYGWECIEPLELNDNEIQEVIRLIQ